MLQYKAVPVGGVDVIDDAEGIVEAFVSVTGIVDQVSDVIEPGAYTKTLATRKPKGIWHHDWTQPTSKTLEAKELMPGDPRLPKTTASGEPWPAEAGALLVKTQFNLNTQRGRDAYEDVKFFGPDQEWSIGYQVPAGGAKMVKGVRHLSTLDLYEYSPVLFGAMPLAVTASVKSAQTAWKALSGVPEGAAIEGLTEEEIAEIEAADDEADVTDEEAAALLSRITDAGTEGDLSVEEIDALCEKAGDWLTEDQRQVFADLREKAEKGAVGGAEKLRQYWTTGKGAAKIRWNTPGDWTRCYRALKEHMGPRAKGYCNNLHKRATGKWSGERDEKDLKVRRVRTAEGARRYGVPIGSVITADMIASVGEPEAVDIGRGATAGRSGQDAARTGRSSSGRLRNFRAMSDEKLVAALEQIEDEGNDEEALDTIRAEASRRGLQTDPPNTPAEVTPSGKPSLAEQEEQVFADVEALRGAVDGESANPEAVAAMADVEQAVQERDAAAAQEALARLGGEYGEGHSIEQQARALSDAIGNLTADVDEDEGYDDSEFYGVIRRDDGTADIAHSPTPAGLPKRPEEEAAAEDDGDATAEIEGVLRELDDFLLDHEDELDPDLHSAIDTARRAAQEAWDDGEGDRNAEAAMLRALALASTHLNTMGPDDPSRHTLVDRIDALIEGLGGVPRANDDNPIIDRSGGTDPMGRALVDAMNRNDGTAAPKRNFPIDLAEEVTGTGDDAAWRADAQEAIRRLNEGESFTTAFTGLYGPTSRDAAEMDAEFDALPPNQQAEVVRVAAGGTPLREALGAVDEIDREVDPSEVVGDAPDVDSLARSGKTPDEIREQLLTEQVRARERGDSQMASFLQEQIDRVSADFPPRPGNDDRLGQIAWDVETAHPTQDDLTVTLDYASDDELREAAAANEDIRPEIEDVLAARSGAPRGDGTEDDPNEGPLGVLEGTTTIEAVRAAYDAFVRESDDPDNVTRSEFLDALREEDPEGERFNLSLIESQLDFLEIDNGPYDEGRLNEIERQIAEGGGEDSAPSADDVLAVLDSGRWKDDDTRNAAEAYIDDPGEDTFRELSIAVRWELDNADDEDDLGEVEMEDETVPFDLTASTETDPDAMSDGVPDPQFVESTAFTVDEGDQITAIRDQLEGEEPDAAYEEALESISNAFMVEDREAALDRLQDASDALFAGGHDGYADELQRLGRELANSDDPARPLTSEAAGQGEDAFEDPLAVDDDPELELLTMAEIDEMLLDATGEDKRRLEAEIRRRAEEYDARLDAGETDVTVGPVAATPDGNQAEVVQREETEFAEAVEMLSNATDEALASAMTTAFTQSRESGDATATQMLELILAEMQRRARGEKGAWTRQEIKSVKAGRVLSGANAAAIRAAVESLIAVLQKAGAWEERKPEVGEKEWTPWSTKADVVMLTATDLREFDLLKAK